MTTSKYTYRSVRPRISFWSDFYHGKALEDSLLSVETEKDISQIAGTFNISLKPSDNMVDHFRSPNQWYDRFDTQDVVGITFDSANNYDKDGDKKIDKGAQFLGLIDDVNRKADYSGDSPNRGTNIVGRDFGSLLMDDSLIYLIEIFLEEGIFSSQYTGIEQSIIEKLKGRHPAFTEGCWVSYGPRFGGDLFTFTDAPLVDAAKWIFENASSIRSLVYKSGESKDVVQNLLDTSNYLGQRPGHVCVGGNNLSTYQGNLLNFIRETIDDQFYETFVDTKNGRAYLRVRPKPFDRVGDMVDHEKIVEDDGDCWENMRSFCNGEPWITISEDEVISEDIRRNKGNIYSVFTVEPLVLKNISKEMALIPQRSAIDLYNLLRYGMKAKSAPIKTNYSELSGKNMENMLRECRDRLRNWHLLAPIFEQGTITIRGREDIRIGDKVYLPWFKKDYYYRQKQTDSYFGGKFTGFYFYVTNVKNRWEIENPFTTTLTLARGQNPGFNEQYRTERNETLQYINRNVPGLYREIEAFKEE